MVSGIKLTDFEILVENSPFGLVMIGPDGTFEYINRKFRELFGYELTEIPNGSEWFNRAYPDPVYRKEVINAWIKDLNESPFSDSRRRIFTVTCKNGTRKVIEFSPVQLPTGQQVLACKDITEQKKFEEERDRLFNLSMDMLCIAGFDGYFRQINPAWTKTLGWSLDELITKPWIDFVHPDDRRETFKIAQNLLIGKPVYSYENRYLCKDGTYRWVSWNSFPLMEDKLIFAVARDTTERKKAESELAINQTRLRAIQDHLPDMLWMKNSEGCFLLVNKAFVAAAGKVSVEEIIGKTDYDLWPQGLAQLYRSDDESVIAERISKTVEEQIMDQGVSKWFETFKTPLYDDEGAVIGTVGSAREITQRKKIEKALRESEEKHRKILETIADGYHEVDLQGNLTLVNDSLCEILGYSRDELIGMSYKQIMDEENARGIREAYNAVFRTGISNPEFSYKVFRKDGTVRDVSVSIAPVRDSNNEPIGFRGIFRDITDRKHLEEQLRQAVKMEAIGRLSGGIAHDFNNLLTAIMGYTNMLGLELPDDKSIQRKLLQITRASARAADLTRQLLAFSRKQVLEVSLVNVNDLVTDIESMLRRLIGEDITLVTKKADKIGKVKADQTQLEQVLVNLAVNARDAMPSGGTITIETHNIDLDEYYCHSNTEVKPGPYVVVNVCDTGHGMSHEILKRIFDPFFTTKEKGVGTGLGLSTVYGIVKQHGGHVTVYSEVGKGTTFKVYLPRSKEARGKQAIQPEADKRPKGSETILLVEDEEAVRDLATEVLAMLGYSVLTASSPREAIEISENHTETISLLLTDVILPEMDGKSLFESLSDKRPEMKVLYVSGYTENFIVHRGILKSKINFLQKPFTIEGLARKVRKVLDGK